MAQYYELPVYKEALRNVTVFYEDIYEGNRLIRKNNHNEGSISKTIYFINNLITYPIRMKGEFYSTVNPEQKMFIDQTYYDIKFNLKINEDEQFTTTNESIEGYEIIEMKPE